MTKANRDPGNSSAEAIRYAIRFLRPPASLFSGLTWRGTMAPDNIVFFKRTDTTEFKPEGVINNYHHRFELVVVLEKAGPVRIGERSYLLQPCEAALVFPNQFHHYMDVEPGVMEWLFITFDLGSSDRIASLKDAPRILGQRELEFLRQIIHDYLHPSGKEPDAVKISYTLSRLLLGMAEAPPIPGSRQDIHSSANVRDVILERINEYIRSHLQKAPAIGTLAAALGYSVSHLRTVFRTELGVSLGKYIRESRLSRAAMLLQSTEMNISEVASESGFDSIFAFSRAFKKAYGVPPKSYSKFVRERIMPRHAAGESHPTK